MTTTSVDGAVTLRSRNRRGQGQLLERDIIAAATRLLERTGAEEAVTLRAVAREAGITAPSIYPHFADRQAILLAVVAATFDQLTAVLQPAAASRAEPVARLRVVCEAYLQFAGEHATLYRVLFQRHRTEPAQGTGQFDVHTMYGAAAFKVLLDAVDGVVQAGRSTATSPLDATIRLWVGLHGLVTLHASLPWFPWPPLDTLLVDITDRLTDLSPTATRLPQD